ncbi:glycosyltransferase family 4 protein [Laspinema olomoucense]|uniref:Glycosyltransferase family 4 protein n=1 Tax=Laspinema olomoucense D3b TaxID=2953688 RepID=A0ABT2NBM0_9CYAN|nr:glycosyltransferase family 4 protein [Laspinema sp. D3b]MCT7979891.1 glycosyltransferase family 4 protein [Laspinema sp. D3b]
MNQSRQNLKRIAIWQPYFMGGGAEAVSLWIMEALAPHYNVTLFTLNFIDFSQLDTLYNTHLTHQNITIHPLLPRSIDTQWINALIANSPQIRFALIHWSIRAFKALTADSDLVFSTYNAVDMGQPGLQYLHWVHVVDPQPKDNKGWNRLIMNLSGFSLEKLKQNQSVANSFYTADRIKAEYGINSRVIYPPVITEMEKRPWEEKEDAFLCSGRIVAAKQTHRVIEILQAVRDRGFDVKLHITGGGGGTYKRSYEQKIQGLADKNSDWIQIYQDLPYKDYLQVLARCRYGIHSKPEPFGISVAEMVKAGMIPFVRDKGGQVEIVGAHHEELLFDNKNATAVEKIVQVLQQRDRQMALLESLKKQQSLFSTEKFISEIQAVVAEYFQN